MSNTSLTDEAMSPAAGRMKTEAMRYLPGGVSAAARVHNSIGRPLFVSKADGPFVYDADGAEFIDLNMSFGASLLGHGHPDIARAIRRALELGVACGYEMEYQGALARRIVDAVPSAELVRFTASGTEAVLYALRVARAFTGRQKAVKFEGHFHGYSDSLGYNFWPPTRRAAPGAPIAPQPESAGMSDSHSDLLIVLPWNDRDALAETLKIHGHEVAAVVMEPVNHDSGTILPLPGYLEAARELTARHGVLLIFDEILSGFRTGLGGAQAHYGVTPDLSVLGKALGGGTPISAFVGRRDVMSVLAPLGPAVHSGTYNGNLIPVLAASAFLDHVSDSLFWSEMAAREAYFYPALSDVFSRAGLAVRVQSAGSRFSLLFGIEREPHNYQDVARHDWELAHRFYRAALSRGVYFHSAWHHGFSAEHSLSLLSTVLERLEEAAHLVAKR